MEIGLPRFRQTDDHLRLCPCSACPSLSERVIMWSEQFHPAFVSLKTTTWYPEANTQGRCGGPQEDEGVDYWMLPSGVVHLKIAPTAVQPGIKTIASRTSNGIFYGQIE
ncbi:hypothetical protein GHT06_014072 [Daphnia sinensis]|uniref:Uncharacterized protein n=1 Tax=Daphnia sinensis TaxID=1820382 RepID=A0AAD5KVW4_9CRUS|nr:hypothetical protein GHT06_014072 [Daphnia sinensis]